MTIDLTTYGRRSGLPRKIEIWWFRVDGRFIITGTPGRRDWLANVKSDPRVIVHVDSQDINATASVVADADFRRSIFVQRNTSWYRSQDEFDVLVRTAPVIELHF